MRPSLGVASWLTVAMLAVGACAAPAATSPTPATTSPTPATTPAATSPTPTESTSPGAAPSTQADALAIHEALALEALLPATVAGRPLARWSVAGRDWIQLAAPSMDIDALLAPSGAASQAPIDLSHLQYAVAGRSNTATDPPYFVFGASRPQDPDEIALALFLLFGGAGFHDLDNAVAGRLFGFAQRSIAGRTVYVGTLEMLDQGEHQRGRPYLYQTDDAMFLVVTDDEDWAKEAIGQLP